MKMAELDPTQIPIDSKRTFNQMTNATLTGVAAVIDGHADLNEEHKKRVKERFEKIYTDCIHTNVLCGGKPWQEAEDDQDKTQDFEPMNLDLQLQVEKQLSKIDECLVKTTRKRKYYPRKIKKNIMCQQKCLQEVLEQYDPERLPKVIIEEHQIDSSSLKSSMKACCQEMTRTLSTLTKSLPSTEVQSERILKILEDTSKEDDKIQNVIKKSLKGEGEMMTSLTPLKKILKEDTTPIIQRRQRYFLQQHSAIQKIRSHSITRYNLRNTMDKVIEPC
ncbi:kinetochore-associated protein NSL1 homolog [Ptychodera flava]|uniref:kinetochore-associated protein NSL1 homolog n=1 Tax=Ptychodera flava TaxID=63121 RepID=UPI00396A7FB2